MVALEKSSGRKPEDASEDVRIMIQKFYSGRKPEDASEDVRIMIQKFYQI